MQSAAPAVPPVGTRRSAAPLSGTRPLQAPHARTWEGLKGGASPFPAPAVNALDGHVDRAGPWPGDAHRLHKGDDLLVFGLRHDPGPRPPGISLGLRQAHVRGALGHLNRAARERVGPILRGACRGPRACTEACSIDLPPSPHPRSRLPPAWQPTRCLPHPAPSPAGVSTPRSGHAPSPHESRALPSRRAASARGGGLLPVRCPCLPGATSIRPPLSPAPRKTGGCRQMASQGCTSTKPSPAPFKAAPHAAGPLPCSTARLRRR